MARFPAGARLKRLLAGAALAALALVAFETSLDHTDDGCPVEIHCLACRWAVSQTAVAPQQPALQPHLVESVRPELPQPRLEDDDSRRHTPSRAPPQA